MRREAQDFDLIETMRFDPSEGIVELDRHLDRMSNSADDLDFKFDRHAARNELQAATFGRKQRAMVRLLLSRTRRDGDPGQAVMTIRTRCRSASPFGRCRSIRAISGLRYKTTDRRFLDQARQREGAYETVFVDPDGQLTEGSRTSIFVERDGKLLTPPLTPRAHAGHPPRKADRGGQGRGGGADARPTSTAAFTSAISCAG